MAMLSRGALCSAPFFTGCGLNREWSGATLSSAASSSADCFLPSTPACLAGFVASFEAESVDCTRPRVSATSNSARRLACRAAGRRRMPRERNLGAFLGPVVHVRERRKRAAAAHAHHRPPFLRHGPPCRGRCDQRAGCSLRHGRCKQGKQSRHSQRCRDAQL